MDTQQMNTSILGAEKSIRDEVRKNSNLAYEELSPLMRGLLAKVYIRGGIDTIEKLRKEQTDQKELLADR